MEKSFFKIASSPFITFIFVLLIQDKGVLRSWVIPSPFSQTEPLFDNYNGTGTRIDMIPAFCTLNLPLLLSVDHLEHLLKNSNC